MAFGNQAFFQQYLPERRYEITHVCTVGREQSPPPKKQYLVMVRIPLFLLLQCSYFLKARGYLPTLERDPPETASSDTSDVCLF